MKAPFVIARRLALMTFLALPTFWPSFARSQISFTLEQSLPQTGLVGRITLLETTVTDESTAVRIAVDIPALATFLDAQGQARGNLGSSRKRLYWVGPSRITGVRDGGCLTVQTRVRLELYVDFDPFGNSLTYTGRDTKTVDLGLCTIWSDAEGRLEIAVEVLNIRNFPGEVEQWLRRAGIDFSARMGVIDLSPEQVAAFTPTLPIHSLTVAPDGQGARLDLELRLGGEAARRGLFALGALLFRDAE